MTSRERLVAAARGGDVDRKPVVSFAGDSGGEVDAIILAPNPVQIELELRTSDVAVLAGIPSIFRLAPPNILATLDSDPGAADKQLGEARDTAQRLIEGCLDAGADGIFYCLFGAQPGIMSPMMYGGNFLELDREVLSLTENSRFSAIFVVGGPGVFLDFVSDLPGEAFGWDIWASGTPVADVRAMRHGAIMTTDPDSDVLISTSSSCLSDFLENNTSANRL
jgi:hypothetical protein